MAFPSELVLKSWIFSVQIKESLLVQFIYSLFSSQKVWVPLASLYQDSCYWAWIGGTIQNFFWDGDCLVSWLEDAELFELFFHLRYILILYLYTNSRCCFSAKP